MPVPAELDTIGHVSHLPSDPSPDRQHAHYMCPYLPQQGFFRTSEDFSAAIAACQCQGKPATDSPSTPAQGRSRRLSVGFWPERTHLWDSALRI
jgi:hypothetical protein